jgi:hypothetical protein
MHDEGLAMASAQYPQEFTWGELTAHVLNPVSGLGNPEPNDASVVLLIDHGNNQLLFTGDIDSTIEAQVVARGTPVAAEILKVAHHGSKVPAIYFAYRISPSKYMTKGTQLIQAAIGFISEQARTDPFDGLRHPSQQQTVPLAAIGDLVFKSCRNQNADMLESRIQVVQVIPGTDHRIWMRGRRIKGG